MHRCGKCEHITIRIKITLAALVKDKLCKTEKLCLHGVLGRAPSGSGSGRYRTPGSFGSFAYKRTPVNDEK